MGCIYSKGTSANAYVENHVGDKGSKKSSKRIVSSSRRDEAIVEVDNGANDATARLISTQPTAENVGSSPPSAWDEREKKTVVVEKPHISRVFSISGGVDGGQVAAGWPSWLTAVAGEAIKGWVPRKADSFEKLDKIGQGTYSSVYRARDLETGKFVALKKVRFVNMDPESVRFMAREILIMRRLDHPNVMKLEGLVTSRVSGNLYLVFEYMEHDLTGLVASSTVKFTEPQELYSGKPIMPGRTEVEQLHKIFKLCGSPSDEYWQKSKLPHATIFKPQHPYKRCVAETFKDFPPSVLALLDVLLSVEPEGRGSASFALQSEFFTTKPLPCDPSSLPKYPPSKEFDAKLRDEEARRQKAAAGKGHANEFHRKGSRESKAVPTPDANAELQASIVKRRGQSNAKSNSEQYNPREDGGSGFHMEPPKGTPQDGLSRSGQLIGAFGSSINEVEALMDSRQPSASSSNGPTLRTQRSFRPQGLGQMSRYNQLDAAESSVNHEWSHHLLEAPKSHKKDEPVPGKEYTAVHALKKNRIHYSGPLLPSGGDIEEMLKEHEKQIQHAVRKARLDKTKTKKMNGDNAQTESLLHYQENGR
ncbi:protein kinase superfamily protein [Actinidia rufa]|uniref:Protein kinase superfamily protein n=1 Tax=Actinidia rufa TaxID=165716 RepID=A0A7J0F7S2_9ERIC|nr:protein kinase superfamily protein [Actinidia rufa]